MTCPMCDPEGYRLLGFLHAESHEQAATDPELCDEDECPHWPAAEQCDCGTAA